MAWTGWEKQRAHGPGASTGTCPAGGPLRGQLVLVLEPLVKDGRLPPALGFMGTSQAPEGVSLLTAGKNDPLPHRRKNITADLILVVGPTWSAKGWRLRGVYATTSEQRYFLLVPSSFA